MFVEALHQRGSGKSCSWGVHTTPKERDRETEQERGKENASDVIQYPGCVCVCNSLLGEGCGFVQDGDGSLYHGDGRGHVACL